jgi:hypothetical protein
MLNASCFLLERAEFDTIEELKCYNGVEIL